MRSVAISGAAGRMGLTLIQLVNAHPSLELQGAVEFPESPAVGQDAGILAGIGACDIKISDEMAATIERVDLVIDFSIAHVAVNVAELCAKHKKGLVIGTTGVDSNGMEAIRRAASQTPILMSPNMSVGVNIAFKLIEVATQALGTDVDIEIAEIHHKHKVDSPSGTAVRMGEIVAAARAQQLKEVAVHGREGEVGERIDGTIGFHSMRGGDVVGEHTVTFAGVGERVEITHRAQSRLNFAAGAIRAAEFISNKITNQETGLYDMDDVLGLT